MKTEIKTSEAPANWPHMTHAEQEHYKVLAQRDALLEACKDLAAICEKNIYPVPDRPSHPWAKLQRAKAAIALVEGMAQVVSDNPEEYPQYAKVEGSDA